MAQPVNDPALLELLNGGGRSVSDPALLEMLNSNPQQAQSSQFAGGDNVKEMNPLMKVLGGAKGAFDRAAYGVGQMVPDILPDSVRNAINDSTLAKLTGLTMPSNQQMSDQVAQGRAFAKEAGGWGTTGEIAADVALMAAPANKLMSGFQAGAQVLPRALSALRNPAAAALTGGTIGAVTNPDDRTGGAAGGAVGGAVGDVAGRALVKTLGGVMSNRVTPDARQLMDDGVFVPMWKGTDSNLVRGIAERGKVLPVFGDIARGQERAAFESFNRNMAGKATPPMPVLDDAGNVLRWENSPIKQSGSDAINALRGRFNDAYDALYQGRGIPVDDVYGNQTAGILESTRNYFPRIADDVGSAFKQVDDILRKGTESTTTNSPILNQAGKNFTNTQLGHASTRPESVKQAIDALDTRIKTAYQRGDSEAAEVFKEMRGAVEQLRMRGLPPEVADQAADINKAYASFMQLQRANSSLGAQKAGLTSPAQMLNAIRANDRTPNKSGFSGGNALNQQDVLRAERVLGNRLPEVGPGTAEKLAPFIGFGAPMLMGDMGMSALLGTKTGQRLLMGGLPGQAGLRQYGNEYLVPALRNIGTSIGN
jgi:hypothetical protein